MIEIKKIKLPPAPLAVTTEKLERLLRGREWHGCSNPGGHYFDEGVCKDCGYSITEPNGGDDYIRRLLKEKR